MAKNIQTIKIISSPLDAKTLAVYCERLFGLRTARAIGDTENVNHTVLGKLQNNSAHINFEILKQS